MSFSSGFFMVLSGLGNAIFLCLSISNNRLIILNISDGFSSFTGGHIHFLNCRHHMHHYGLSTVPSGGPAAYSMLRHLCINCENKTLPIIKMVPSILSMSKMKEFRSFFDEFQAVSQLQLGSLGQKVDRRSKLLAD
ncbi:hypothetical protein JRO89_XS01G0237500 [Xanthoceras sorbifolium]|uniref:Uncharacterized protein n=1 Tax=Xanthoceras sorbifolium TaxID=99658 RepID=A0ABQ8ILL3_9ROSI|nr:hypothetical protein JRO89_XS01G0237500 [Xanthoceras sorbifolium]